MTPVTLVVALVVFVLALLVGYLIVDHFVPADFKKLGYGLVFGLGLIACVAWLYRHWDGLMSMLGAR